MITPPFKTVYGLVIFLIWVEYCQLAYVINVTGLTEGNPTPLLLVKEKYHLCYTKLFEWASSFAQPDITHLEIISAPLSITQTQYKMKHTPFSISHNKLANYLHLLLIILVLLRPLIHALFCNWNKVFMRYFLWNSKVIGSMLLFTNWFLVCRRILKNSTSHLLPNVLYRSEKAC